MFVLCKAARPLASSSARGQERHEGWAKRLSVRCGAFAWAGGRSTGSSAPPDSDSQGKHQAVGGEGAVPRCATRPLCPTRGARCVCDTGRCNLHVPPPPTSPAAGPDFSRTRAHASHVHAIWLHAQTRVCAGRGPVTHSGLACWLHWQSLLPGMQLVPVTEGFGGPVCIRSPNQIAGLAKKPLIAGLPGSTLGLLPASRGQTCHAPSQQSCPKSWQHRSASQGPWQVR